MPTDITPPAPELNDAEAACKRLEGEAASLTEAEYTPLNIDVVGATSTILGVAPRILTFRDEMAKLYDFDIKHIDTLVDRARACWFVWVTNLPEPEPIDFAAMYEECVALRKTLLMWAVPLVHDGKFGQDAIDEITEGSGRKDTVGDLVALVKLYRNNWQAVHGRCGVSEQQLDRASHIASIAFDVISRQENRALYSQTEGAARVRRFWSLADTAYDQCQRALVYLRWKQGDALVIAPSLRRNNGPRATQQNSAPASPATPPSPPAPAPVEGPVVGGGKGPFDK